MRARFAAIVVERGEVTEVNEPGAGRLTQRTMADDRAHRTLLCQKRSTSRYVRLSDSRQCDLLCWLGRHVVGRDGCGGQNGTGQPRPIADAEWADERRGAPAADLVLILCCVTPDSVDAIASAESRRTPLPSSLLITAQDATPWRCPAAEYPPVIRSPTAAAPGRRSRSRKSASRSSPRLGATPPNRSCRRRRYRR
jgi:hypothetical protein